MLVAAHFIPPFGQTRNVAVPPATELAIDRGVQGVVIAGEASLTVSRDVQVVACFDPEDVVPHLDVHGAAIHQHGVPYLLIDRVVHNPPTVGRVDVNPLVGIAVDQVVRNQATKPAIVVVIAHSLDADRIGIHNVSSNRTSVVDRDACARVVVDAVVLHCHVRGAVVRLDDSRSIIEHFVAPDSGLAVSQIDADRLAPHLVVCDQRLIQGRNSFTGVVMHLIVLDHDLVCRHAVV